MDALEMALLFDCYGGLLTEKQSECFDMRYNQDMSLGEIAQELGVSRQAVSDNLTRTEALLRKMEENVGCVRRLTKSRNAAADIRAAAEGMMLHSDSGGSDLAKAILFAVQDLEE